MKLQKNELKTNWFSSANELKNEGKWGQRPRFGWFAPATPVAEDRAGMPRRRNAEGSGWKNP